MDMHFYEAWGWGTYTCFKFKEGKAVARVPMSYHICTVNVPQPLPRSRFKLTKEGTSVFPFYQELINIIKGNNSERLHDLCQTDICIIITHTLVCDFMIVWLCQTDICIIVTYTSLWIHDCMIYIRQTYVLLSHTLVCDFMIVWLCQTDICIIVTHTSLWIHDCMIYIRQTYVLLSHTH